MLQVVDTGHVALGGLSLRYVDVAYLDELGQQSEGPLTMTERLGSSPMVIIPGGCIIVEAGASLRTYEDNSFPLYDSGEPNTCDQFSGIDDRPRPGPAFDLYPNPASATATLTWRHEDDPLSDRMSTLLIFNAQGSLVRSTDLLFAGGKVVIDLHGLPSGLFTLRLVDLRGRWSSAKLAVD